MTDGHSPLILAIRRPSRWKHIGQAWGVLSCVILFHGFDESRNREAIQDSKRIRPKGALYDGEESEDPHLCSFMHRVFAGECPKIGCPEHHGNYSRHRARSARRGRTECVGLRKNVGTGAERTALTDVQRMQNGGGFGSAMKMVRFTHAGPARPKKFNPAKRAIAAARL